MHVCEHAYFCTQGYGQTGPVSQTPLAEGGSPAERKTYLFQNTCTYVVYIAHNKMNKRKMFYIFKTRIIYPFSLNLPSLLALFTMK